MLDIRRLRYFQAIARLGSMAAASRALNVAQPSLSQHIAELESAIGAPLFIRFSRGVRLTEVGERLRDHAEQILASVEQAETDVIAFVRRQQARRMLRLALLPSWSASLTPSIIAETAKRLPDLTLRIIELRNDDAIKALDEDAVDLAVILSPRSRNLPHALVEEPLLYVSASRGQPVITLRALVDLPLILPPPDNQLRGIVDQKAEAHGLVLKPVVEIDGQDTIKSAIEAGMGGSIMSWNSVRHECLAGRLHVSRIVEPALGRTVYLGLGKGVEDKLAADIFSIIADVAENSLRDIDASAGN